jgi:hypothetical protein
LLGHHLAPGDSRRGLYKNAAREPHGLSIPKRTVLAYRRVALWIALDTSHYSEYKQRQS